MTESERFKLHFGPYKTPHFNFGDIVDDERRGEVEIVCLTDGLIPWPIGRPTQKGHRRERAIVLFDALVTAVQNESNEAVAHWWGVGGQTVTKWRHALGVARMTDGQRRLSATNYFSGIGAKL